ncbi:mannose-6-phosphate isomerase, class I [Leifsonia sp. RAF41]|uniref:mannose-6-phosphate isomerase, class I n=1 Tax=Leifsonia sp. RAF41 TaxID=3233056 RepID=UPI003F97DB16
MMRTEQAAILHGTHHRYAWGSTQSIQDFCELEQDGLPLAEVWFGAHPSAPSLVAHGDELVPLDHVIQEDPEGNLGEVQRAYGDSLPFLVKLLAPQQAVSLQVHPNRTQAELGFAKEEQQGVPLGSAERSFVDRNHKPEMVIAITDFEGLVGFRHSSQIAESLAGAHMNPFAQRLLELLREERLSEAFAALLRAEPHQVSYLVDELLVNRAGDAAIEKVRQLTATYPSQDPGLLASMFLNIVRLKPGEAVFVGAGVPHSYQGGLAAEVMANSDNVIRAGLTKKFVDVDGLLSTVDFDSAAARVLSVHPANPYFEIPVPDFSVALLHNDATLAQSSPRIALALSKGVRIQSGVTTLELDRGQAAFVPASVGALRISGGTTLVAGVGGTSKG